MNTNFDASFYQFLDAPVGKVDDLADLRQLVSPSAVDREISSPQTTEDKIRAILQKDTAITRLNVSQLCKNLHLSRGTAKKWIKEINAYRVAAARMTALRSAALGMSETAAKAAAPNQKRPGLVSGLVNRFRQSRALKKLAAFSEQIGMLSDSSLVGAGNALQLLRKRVSQDYGDSAKVISSRFMEAQRRPVAERVIQFYQLKKEKIAKLRLDLSHAQSPVRRQVLQTLLWKEESSNIRVVAANLKYGVIQATIDSLGRAKKKHIPDSMIQEKLRITATQQRSLEVMSAVRVAIRAYAEESSQTWSSAMIAQIAQRCMREPLQLMDGGQYALSYGALNELSKTLHTLMGPDFKDVHSAIEEAQSTLALWPDPTEDDIAEHLGVTRGDVFAMRLGDAYMRLGIEDPTEKQLAQALGVSELTLQAWYSEIQTSQDAVVLLTSLGVQAGGDKVSENFYSDVERLLEGPTPFKTSPTPGQMINMNKIVARLKDRPELQARAQTLLYEMIGNVREKRLKGVVDLTEMWSQERALGAEVRNVKYRKIEANATIATEQPATKRTWVDTLPGMYGSTWDDPAVVDSNSDFLPAREKLHQEIVSKAIGDAKPVAQNEKPTAIVIIGGVGSGKDAVAASMAAGGDFVHVNRGTVAEQLPEYQQAVNPVPGKPISARDAALRVEAEAEMVAGHIEKAATQGRYNIVYEGIGQSGSSRDRINKLKEQGYHVRVVMVDQDQEAAVGLARQRAESTGHYVPDSIVRATQELARRNFPTSASVADEAMLFDNRGGKPKLVWQRSGDQTPVVDAEFFTSAGDGLERLPGAPKPPGSPHTRLAFESPQERAEFIITRAKTYIEGIDALQVEALLRKGRANWENESSDWLAECLCAGVEEVTLAMLGEVFAQQGIPTPERKQLSRMASQCFWVLAQKKKSADISDIFIPAEIRALTDNASFAAKIDEALARSKESARGVLERIVERQNQRLEQIKQGINPKIANLFHGTTTLKDLTSIGASEIEVGWGLFRGAYVSTTPEFGYGFQFFGLAGPLEQSGDPDSYRALEVMAKRWTGYDRPVEIHPKARELQGRLVNACVNTVMEELAASPLTKEIPSGSFDRLRAHLSSLLADSIILRYDDEKREWVPFLNPELFRRQKRTEKTPLSSISAFQEFIGSMTQIAGKASGVDVENIMGDEQTRIRIAERVASVYHADTASLAVKEPMLKTAIIPAAVFAPDDDPLLNAFWKHYSKTEHGNKEVNSVQTVTAALKQKMGQNLDFPVIPLFEELVELSIVQSAFGTAVPARYEDLLGT